jgi:hypothetical protein
MLVDNHGGYAPVSWLTMLARHYPAALVLERGMVGHLLPRHADHDMGWDGGGVGLGWDGSCSMTPIHITSIYLYLYIYNIYIKA